MCPKFWQSDTLLVLVPPLTSFNFLEVDITQFYKNVSDDEIGQSWLR